MSEFSLLPGEEVIRRNDETAIGGPGRINLGIRKDSLILTNQSLICIKRGLLGKVKDVKRYSLSDIIIANGKPQVQSGRFDNVPAAGHRSPERRAKRCSAPTAEPITLSEGQAFDAVLMK